MMAKSLSNSSLAHKYGLLCKENNSFGLNPNLNIEDQYIENLLKQIHFMNMEIKLLKEKQKQSEGNNLYGIINRSDQPLMRNILDSSQKYQTMRSDADFQVNSLANQNQNLADQQKALLHRHAYLESKGKEIQQSKKRIIQQSHETEQKVVIKIQENQLRLKKLAADKEKETKKNAQLTRQSHDLVAESKKEEFRNSYENAKIRNEEIIQEMVLQGKDQQVASLQAKINELKQKFCSNSDYQKASQQKQQLEQKMQSLQKQLAGADFELLQLNDSLAIAEREKQKEMVQRKKHTEELEASKVMIQEILLLNVGRKEREILCRRKNSPQIQRADSLTVKLESLLEDLKRKLYKVQDSQKNLKNEADGDERQLERLKLRRDRLAQQYKKLSSNNESQETSLKALSFEMQKLQRECEKGQHDQLVALQALIGLEKDIHYLRGKKQSLCQAHNKETVDQTKLEELRRMVQKNKDVNETVDMLMGKWEDIKNFSRI